MAPLEHENDIEVLRQYSLLATKEITRLQQLVSQLQGNGSGEQSFLSDDLKDQLCRLKEKYFGFGREHSRRAVTHHEGQQLLLHGGRSTEPKEESERGRPKDSEKKIERIYGSLQGELQADAEDRGYTVSDVNELWEELEGLTQDHVEITVVERVYQKVVHRQKKYLLKPTKGTDKEVIHTAKGPVKLKPGCKYSVDFALSVVSDKYEYHLPLERQRRKLEDAGLDVSVKTLYNLCEAVSDHVQAVMEPIRKDILADKNCAAHIDETTWPLLGNDSQSYLWVLSNRTASYYQFEPTRSGKVAMELLKGHQGAILTDGFSGYNRVKKMDGIIVGNCWAHARREFFELYGSYPKEVDEILDLMDELFAIERQAKTWDQLKELRETESTLQCKKIHEWLFQTRQKHLRSSGLVKAIDYCLGRWKELTAFLKEIALPLTNNDAERALRHAVIGRKNFAGSKTINGADVAANLYTVIESYKKVGLKPRVYLKYLIEERWHKRQPLSPLNYVHMINGELSQ